MKLKLVQKPGKIDKSRGPAQLTDNEVTLTLIRYCFPARLSLLASPGTWMPSKGIT